MVITIGDQVSVATAKARLSEVIDGVEAEHCRVVITKHGRPSVVVVSVEDLAALEETLDLLSDPEAMAELREADEARDSRDHAGLTKDEALAAGPMTDYDLRWSSPSVRQLDRVSPRAPRSVGPIVEFCYGRLTDNLQRVGRALQRELTGKFSARVGPYPVIYTVDESEHVDYVDRADHRSDVYRTR